MDGLRIVLIDDEELIIDVVKTFMEEMGASVHAFTHAAEGLDFIRRHHNEIDVVVTDFKMPGALTGGDIYNVVTKEYQTIVCFILTGFIDVMPKGIDAQHIVYKPINFSAFLSEIRKACGRETSE